MRQVCPWRNLTLQKKVVWRRQGCDLIKKSSTFQGPIPSSKIKYLGIYIDSHLSWHDHIDYICDKVSKSINMMTKIKSYLGNQCSIYYSLVYPYLIYGSLLWGNNYDNPLSQLIRASAPQLW